MACRCVCPHHTWGGRCKVLARHFKDDPDGNGGWAWVPSLPSCMEMHISLEVLTRSKDATLLYSGPNHLPPRPGATSDMMMLELRSGRPSLLLDLGAGPVALTLNTSYSLADYTWHRLDLIWKDEVRQLCWSLLGVPLCGAELSNNLILDELFIESSFENHNFID